MSNTVNQTEFINYISEFKKIFVTKVNSPVTQLFKLDSNISDQYYFQILNKNNQVVELTGRTFQIYGSIVDAKDITHILFYTPSGTVEENNVLHFHINTYNQQYLAQIKTTKQANVTIVETTGGNTQVILRDVGLFYKRPYVDNQIPAEVYTVRILTGSLPWQNEFGAGQNINLIEGTPNYAFGSNLSTASNQFVIGDTNTSDGTKAFIVANSGNVFTVDYEGNVEANAISATSLTVNGSQVATAADLTGLATESYVDAAVSGKADLSSVYTKENVYTYLETDQKILEATSGKADKSELTAYALQSDLALSTANLSYQIATLNIPTKTSDLTNDSGYITGYTAGSGISISNQNVISIDGELGKTYYADDTTLQLNENNNTFSVKSIRTKLNNGPGISLSQDGNGVVTITNTGGSGGGGGYVYTAGTGLALSAVVEDEQYEFYVDQAWFNQHIDAYTSGLQNLSAGTGLKIEDNVISLTAEIPSVEGLASEEWVEQNFLSSIPANYVTSAQLTGALSAYAKTTDLDNYVTNDTLTGYVTTEQLAEEGFATTSALDTASTTIVNSLTGYIETSDLEAVSGELVNAIGANQTAINEVSGVVNTKTTSAQVTEIITSYVGENLSAVSQLVNDTGFITLSSIPDTSDFATKEQVQYVSSVVSALPTSQIEYTAGTNISISDQNVISMTATIPSVEGLASEQYVDNAVSSKAETSALNELSTTVENLNIPTELSGSATIDITDNVISLANANTYAKTTDIPTISTYVGGNLISVTSSDTNQYTIAFTGTIPSIEGLATEDYVTSQVSGKADLSTVATVSSNLTATIDYVNDKIIHYTAGEGLKLENDQFSLTATIPDVSNFIDATSAETIATEVLSAASGNIVTVASTAIDSAYIAGMGFVTTDTTYSDGRFISISGDANTINCTLTGLDQLSNEETQFITASDIPPGTVYLAGDGLKLDNATFSLTGTILTGGNLIEVDGKSINFTGTIPTTVAELTDAGDYALKTDIPTDVATSAYVQSASGNAVNVATGWVEEQGYLTGVDLTDYYTKSEINTSTGAIDDRLTALENAGYQNATEVLSAITGTVNSGYVRDFGFALTSEIPSIQGLATENDLQAVSAAIPTSTSQLTNDNNFISSLVVEGMDYEYNSVSVSATQLNFQNDWFTLEDNTNNQVTVYFKGMHIYGNDEFWASQIDFDTSVFSVTEGSENSVYISLATPIPLSTSELINDSGYITGIADNALLSDIKTYTAGTGLKLDGTEFSLTAAIPSIDGLASEQYVNNAIDGLSAVISIDYAKKTDLPTVPTNVSDFTNDAGYQNATEVGNAITTTVTSSYVAGLGMATTGAVNDVATGLTELSTYTYTLPTSDTTYTAGTGLKLNGTEFSLTATIPQLSSVYDLLSGVNIDITQDATGKITLSAATGGGGGGGSTYTAGIGINITSDVISVDPTELDLSEFNNDVLFITNNDLTNKQRVSDPTPTATIIDYHPAYEIFKTYYTVSNGAIELSAVTDTSGLLTNGDVATFEEWITTDADCTAAVATGINLVGEIPSLTSGNYHVFVRRLVKTGNTVTQYVSFAYQAAIPE